MENRSRASIELDAWDEAYRRVENYLHACGVAPRLLLTELAMAVIEEAQRRATQTPDEHPVMISMRVALERLAAGIEDNGSESARGSEEQLRARGRLALATSGAAPRWASHVLSGQTSAAELRACYDDRPLQSGPEIRLSKLPPAPLEFAFGDDEDMPIAPWRVPVSGLAVVLGVVGAMGAAWAASH